MKDFFPHSVFARTGLIGDLRARFSATSLLTAPEACVAYATRGMADAGDAPQAVVLVETTKDVQDALAICHAHGAQAVPRGAGTNLTCAVSPGSDTVIICTSRMRGLSDFDAVSGTIRVQAGVRNQAVSDYVAQAGWFYAPDPSSRRNCTIGGNIATNSGGSSSLRSGVTVNHIAGLTVVRNDGSLRVLGGERYDADGLDLASVMCGAEGRMGFVVEAVLRLSPIQPDRAALLIALVAKDQAQAIGADILASGVVPAQMDYLDPRTAALCEAQTGVGYPDAKGGIILIDLIGSACATSNGLDKISQIAQQHGVNWTAFAAPQAAAKIWQGRERIYGAVARVSRYVATDVAVPLSKITKMLDLVDACVQAAGLTHATTAHLGDGTVHSFVFYDGKCEETRQVVEHCGREIRKAAIRIGGTATSEYGTGTKHRDLLSEQFTPTDLQVQARCAETLDGRAPVAIKQVGGLSSMHIYSPETEQEAARVIRDATTGAFEVTGRNRAARGVGCSVLSANALRGITHHDPTEFTVTVRAGTPLEQLSNYLLDFGQRLTFDVPQDAGGVTVGAAVARNFPTSRRPFAGSVRDGVLATRAVTGLGEIIATGARVLKNAAGLDLGKALVGSLGQLCFLTEATFRVVPTSDGEHTALVGHTAAEDFPAQVAQFMQTGLDIMGAAHVSADLAEQYGLEGPAMVLRVSSKAGGHEGVSQARVLPDAQAASLWDALPRGDVFGSAHEHVALISCLPSTGGVIAARLRDIGAAVAMDWRGGLVWACVHSPQDRARLTAIAQEHSDARLRWRPSPDDPEITDRISPLKPALDPLGRFKPVPTSTHFPI
ncbi:FAD-binding protein [Octadecabacter sp.]|nr:FAD-binding protein [Octadecabacter sp.]